MKFQINFIDDFLRRDSFLFENCKEYQLYDVLKVTRPGTLIYPWLHVEEPIIIAKIYYQSTTALITRLIIPNLKLDDTWVLRPLDRLNFMIIGFATPLNRVALLDL